MRAWPLVVLTALSLSLPALAQDEAEVRTADGRQSNLPPPEVKAAIQAAGRPASSPAAAPGAADMALQMAARELYANLLYMRNSYALSSACKLPFFFEDRAVNSVEELQKAWLNELYGRKGEPKSNPTLYNIELLTPEAAAERFGPPPQKLAKWNMKGGMISVANVDGRASFVLWRKQGQAWFAYGIHD